MGFVIAPCVLIGEGVPVRSGAGILVVVNDDGLIMRLREGVPAGVGAGVAAVGTAVAGAAGAGGVDAAAGTAVAGIAVGAAAGDPILPST